MGYAAEITEIQRLYDGGVWFTFRVYDTASPDHTIVTHSQGIAPEAERVPEDGTENMIETGRTVPPSADTIREAIANFIRDVAPLHESEPPVGVGETIET